MAFEATRKEWSSLYVFFRLLADGYLNSSVISKGSGKEEMEQWLVAAIRREEHDGSRNYILVGEKIRIVGKEIDKFVARTDFAVAADTIIKALKENPEAIVASPQGIEQFLDECSIFDLKPQDVKRIDFYIAFWNIQMPEIGFTVQSRLGGMVPLLDGGRTANLKFELGGIKFAVPMVNKVNALEGSNPVKERIGMIERLGGVLKYSDVADRVFRSNLCMVDLHFPRMLAAMLRIMYAEDMTKVNELVERVKEINPLKIKEELVAKHGFYEYKMKLFLTALATGMRPAKIFKGTDSSLSGCILMDVEGNLTGYHQMENKIFEDFLYGSTRLERGSTEKDKYGYIEKENGVYYLKLNLKIGFIKR